VKRSWNWNINQWGEEILDTGRKVGKKPAPTLQGLSCCYIIRSVPERLIVWIRILKRKEVEEKGEEEEEI
jgi:hypothetical protein